VRHIGNACRHLVTFAPECGIQRSAVDDFSPQSGAWWAKHLPGLDLLKASLLSFAALAASAAVTFASPACEGLRMGARGVVTEVVDGDTVMLDNGVVVRLIGTQAPKLPLGREGFPTWPMAEAARAALADLLLGKSVQLGYGGEEIDRYERALAHVFVTDAAGEPALWAQQAMVSAGLARVYSFPDNRKCLAELYAAELQARLKGIGIWTDPFYAVRAADHPEAILERAGWYELVEGRVLLADEAGSRVYLNFGRHWKEDFTVVIERAALRLFEEDGRDPLALDGALVRVRGWVDDRDGPRIEVTHPEQIEVLAAR
jgi:endonuclease YncB( thermonuclease family)